MSGAGATDVVDDPGRRGGLLRRLGPGILVAATGVGAGDLATAGLAGAKLGLVVGWAIVLGAILKYILSEQLARWQLGTGETVLEGAITRLGWPLYVAFIVYLVPWSIAVGTALVGACGSTLQALTGAFDDPEHGKIVFGIASSVLGAVLVLIGGFKLFERLMAVCIAVMVVVTGVAAVLAAPDLAALSRGLLVPAIPGVFGAAPAVAEAADGGSPTVVEGIAAFGWTIALLGGVGGTLTIICYAYWMRETGRTAPGHLARCRWDLRYGYALTAAFGIGILILASRTVPDGRGVALLTNLADAVGGAFAGRFGDGWRAPARFVFLLGTTMAVFSSVVGVWQSVPYVFADWWGQRRRVGCGTPREAVRIGPRDRAVLVGLGWLTLVSLAGLGVEFGLLQLIYTIIGAAFVPGLALVLLLLNGVPRFGMPAPMRNGAPRSTVLALTFVVLSVAGAWGMAQKLGWLDRTPPPPAESAAPADTLAPAESITRPG